MDPKLAKKLIDALDANTKAVEESNRLTRLLAGRRPVQSPQPQQSADPLTAHLKQIGVEQ